MVAFAAEALQVAIRRCRFKLGPDPRIGAGGAACETRRIRRPGVGIRERRAAAPDLYKALREARSRVE
jgi:hypothetical protein